MEDFTEVSMGAERVRALVLRDRIAHNLGCAKHNKRDETLFWLALLGWTEDAYLREAYPEMFGRSRRGRGA